MARLSDLKLRHKIFMRGYRYRQRSWLPALLEKPLQFARLAVITTAALYLPGQEPFDESIRGGDVSFREIQAGVDLSLLKIAHKSDAFDHTGIEADKNLALPLDRLREWVEEGKLGSAAAVHFSFMGSISAPGRLIAQTAPKVARHLQDDGVDAVLLTPV